MTVGELIERLLQYPATTHVYAATDTTTCQITWVHWSNNTVILESEPALTLDSTSSQK
jgi:hypothetical protein